MHKHTYFDFLHKNSRKHLTIAVKYMKDGGDIEITDRKADTIYSALSNEIDKCGRDESLSRCGNEGASVIIVHKNIALKGIIPK